MKVLFSEVSEFLQELERESPPLKPGQINTSNVMGLIVRLTSVRTTMSTSPLAQISVLSTFRTNVPFDTVVELKTEVGSTFRFDPSDESSKKVWNKAKEIYDEIEAKCKDLGLEVRAGRYEP